MNHEDGWRSGDVRVLSCFRVWKKFNWNHEKYKISSQSPRRRKHWPQSLRFRVCFVLRFLRDFCRCMIHNGILIKRNNNNCSEMINRSMSNDIWDGLQSHTHYIQCYAPDDVLSRVQGEKRNTISFCDIIECDSAINLNNQRPQRNSQSCIDQVAEELPWHMDERQMFIGWLAGRPAGLF